MIYLVWLRVAPLAGCKAIPESFDPRLECALPAESEQQVRATLERALARDRYGIETLESCRAYDPEDWDDRNDPGGDVRATAQAALASGQLVFGSFARQPDGDVAPRRI